jgi:hypothetical protein
VEKNIVDAIGILKAQIDSLNSAFEYCGCFDCYVARHALARAIQYLAKPDRHARAKRGPSAVKTGKGKNPRRHIKMEVS